MRSSMDGSNSMAKMDEEGKQPEKEKGQDDIEAQVARIVEDRLDARSNMLDDRLGYWRKEYDWQIQGRFDQINKALLA